jgi:NAD(P)-dependent dehydrogenase (short-subunit alcohol dehydrogenase family)
VGLATALRFSSAGYRVFVCGRDKTRLDAAVTQIHDALRTGAERSAVDYIALDLAQSKSPRTLCDTVVKRMGRIDVLVNNAAAAPLAPIDEMSDTDIDSTIDLNIGAVYKLTRAVWPVMKGQGSGIVINLSSRAAVDPFPGFSMYGATKAWIELFTLALAREGRESGIRSFCVRPGAIETPMLRGLFSDFPAEQTVTPDDVARLIWSICQPDFQHSSGQVVEISRQ